MTKVLWNVALCRQPTRCNIPQGLNHQQLRCEKLISRNIQQLTQRCVKRTLHIEGQKHRDMFTKTKLKSEAQLQDYSVSYNNNVPRAMIRLVYKTGIKEPKGSRDLSYITSSK